VANSILEIKKFIDFPCYWILLEDFEDSYFVKLFKETSSSKNRISCSPWDCSVRLWASTLVKSTNFILYVREVCPIFVVYSLYKTFFRINMIYWEYSFSFHIFTKNSFILQYWFKTSLPFFIIRLWDEKQRGGQAKSFACIERKKKQ